MKRKRKDEEEEKSGLWRSAAKTEADSWWVAKRDQKVGQPAVVPVVAVDPWKRWAGGGGKREGEGKGERESRVVDERVAERANERKYERVRRIEKERE